jgi:N-acetylmuramoyl-L-alanine amidase
VDCGKKEQRKVISATRMRRKLGYILTVIFLAPFFMCASETRCTASAKPVVLLKEADQCREALSKSAKKKKYRRNWDRCLGAYENIYSRYPESGQAPWALYHSGRLYTELYKYSGRSKDLDEAISIFRQLVDDYKDHRLADDAQYLIGKIFYEQKKDTTRAYEEFLKVEREFPSGDMLPRARKMLAKLSGTVKKHEVLSNKSKKPAELLKEADRCRMNLSKSAKKKKYRRNWDRCLYAYKNVYSRYPESDQAPWALYRSGGLYTGLYKYSWRSKDLDEAISIYRRLVEGYKDHRLADDAQYRIGEIYKLYKKDFTQAYVEFLKVDIKFPSGDMQHRARKMLDELAVTLSKREEAKAKKASVALESGLTPVKDIRYWSTPTYTRVVVDLTGPVKYEHHLLKADPDHKKPRRIYLDLRKSHVTSQIDRPIAIKDGLLQMARAGQYTKDTVRVVLDIESIGGYKVFHLHDPFRIVVDVGRQVKDDTKAKTKPALKKRPTRKGIRKAKDPDRTVSLARQLGLNVKRVVIDPGHGGKDPGCFARGGIKEKDIVLSLAKILSKKIEKEIGCEVLLTRTGDVFIPLERRTAVANMKKADLFISLHVNAHRSKKIRGLETYFLNMATDKRAVMVAARENATSEKNISDLQTILNDLMLNTKLHESSRLAHEVQKGMISQTSRKYKNVKDLGVKQAPFYVLIGAQMPAILVEIGFLTNITERKRLVSKGYQERIAEGIVAGISAYTKSIGQAYKGG